MCIFLLFTSLFALSSAIPLRDPKFLPPEYLPFMETDLSRTVPKRKPLNPYDSPIYYIRLPPNPYMFVPGLGYVSQPPPPPPQAMSPFVSLPIDFVANGKPSTIYQWAAGETNNFEEPPKTQPEKNKKKPSSNVHQLGEFAFNGKPDNVFVLRDSYNALYGDALQNFYP